MNFTIHGLWPTSLEGIIEPPCNKDIKEEVVPNFDFDPDYKLKMGIYWPGLYNNNTLFGNMNIINMVIAILKEII